MIKHFHNKRLNKLWNNPIDENGGFYQGYYDDGVGAGEEFFVKGRGYHPEWYLFRLPIIDCYLTKNHNKQIITFGPKLTDEEINEIDRLASLRPTSYGTLFGHHRPSLSEMKRLYDIAISKTPRCDVDGMSSEEKIMMYNKINRQAVDSLVSMRG